jgi:two-component system, LytTR family, response regulator
MGEQAPRVLIVDDEVVARSRMRRLLASAGVTDVIEAVDGPAAVRALERHEPAIVFLDIQMPELNGFGVMERIGPERMPVTVFVTAYEEYATRAFEAAAVDYLVKPYEDSRFLAALTRARARVSDGRLRELGERFESLLALQRAGDSGTLEVDETGPLRRLVIKKNGRIRLIRTESIDWIEAEGMYTRVHFTAESYLLRIPMHEMETRLDSNSFIRTHRSAIVNLERVRELIEVSSTEMAIVMENGARVKLSRARRAALERRLGQSL